MILAYNIQTDASWTKVIVGSKLG